MLGSFVFETPTIACLGFFPKEFPKLRNFPRVSFSNAVRLLSTGRLYFCTTSKPSTLLSLLLSEIHHEKSSQEKDRSDEKIDDSFQDASNADREFGGSVLVGG